MATKASRTTQHAVILKPGHLLHVETPLGIVNIRAGLRDDEGRDVDAIEVLPDLIGNVVVDGFITTRLILARDQDDAMDVLNGRKKST